MDEDGDAAIATSRGVSGSFGSSVAYSFLQAMATRGLGGPDRARLRRRALAERRSIPRRSAPRPGTRRPRCSARGSRSRAPARWCSPSGSRPASPASSAAPLSADEVQRGRSPFADRLGDELASPAYVLADDGIDPGGLASAPFDGEGTPRERTPLIADGKLLAYLHDSYTARRGGARSTGNASRSSYRSAPSVSPSNLVLEPGRAHPRAAAASGPATASTSPTSRAFTRASTRSRAATRSGASGRAIRGGELGRAAPRVHDRRRPARHAGGRPGRAAQRPAGSRSAAR